MIEMMVPSIHGLEVLLMTNLLKPAALLAYQVADLAQSMLDLAIRASSGRDMNETWQVYVQNHSKLRYSLRESPY